MPESIISVGLQIPGGKIEYARHTEKISLLDWDIAIITTNMNNSFYYGSDTYNGKYCLSDDASFSYTEGIYHWKKEINEAFNNGKAVIILLDEYEEIYIATGTRSYSGTGRNQKTTRHIAPANNYSFLPFQLEIRNSIGTQMILNPKFQYLKEFWSTFSGSSSYKVTSESKDIIPLIKTKSGNKTVGGIFFNKESGGYILLIPYIDFDRDEFTETRGKNKYWSDAGLAFGNSFISSIISINKNIRSSSDKTPQPEWSKSEKYLIQKEIEIREKIIEKKTKLDKLQLEVQRFKEQLLQENSIKDLLFEQGKSLEYAIMKALKNIGFKVSQYKENDSEFDVIFECEEGRLIGEAEGKDNKPINIDKLRQLEMNINEDFSRDEIKTMAKGVLFGNSCRLKPIEERNEFFTEKCLIAAERSNVALVKTQDLFFVCQNIDNLSEKEKSEIRIKILSTTGLVDFSEFFSNLTSETSDQRS